MKVEDPAILVWIRTLPCGLCRAPAPSEPHHVMTRGAGGGDTALNLIPLCRGCHDRVQDNPEGRRECLEAIAFREGLLNGGVVQDAILRLRNRGKWADPRYFEQRTK